MDGQEHIISKQRNPGPEWLVWTRDSEAGWYGFEYGNSKTPGPRYLRIGFTRAVPVGTICISVLKPTAAYPGDLNDDTQWITAQCINRDGIVASENAPEVSTRVLPPGTTTRALRFTHVAKQSDRRYNGWVGAVLLWPRDTPTSPPRRWPVPARTVKRLPW